jgi:siroheme synthase-like protein
MQLYPVMLNLENRRVVIIGGGAVALRKTRDLLEAGAGVRVIAPQVHDDMQALAGAYGASLEILRRPYQPGTLLELPLFLPQPVLQKSTKLCSKKLRKEMFLLMLSMTRPTVHFLSPLL